MSSATTVSDLFAQIDEERRNATKLEQAWWRVERGLARLKDAPRNTRRMVVRSYQRVRHGWAHEDTWNFDRHLARIIGEGLIHLSENTHGYPGVGEYDTAEKWEADLCKHGTALLEYTAELPDEDDYDAAFAEEERRYLAAKDSMRWVAEYLGNLWD